MPFRNDEDLIEFVSNLYFEEDNKQNEKELETAKAVSDEQKKSLNLASDPDVDARKPSPGSAKGKYLNLGYCGVANLSDEALKKFKAIVSAEELDGESSEKNRAESVKIRRSYTRSRHSNSNRKTNEDKYPKYDLGDKETDFRKLYTNLGSRWIQPWWDIHKL